MVAVRIESVWKYYGKTVAVRDLTLECPENGFLCILGPSGCGKSTTLRMLAGLEHISAGDVFFDERRVNDLPPKDRDIAMVFENYALYPHKTVFDNIANPLRLRGVDAVQAQAKVERVAKLLQIDGLLHRKPAELSGGQKQRTAIGRAIVREPRLFLFDEPIAHLDAKLRAHMRGELKRLQRQLATTTVYVTHDQLEALSMADHIAVMHEGVLQQHATPDEIYNHPVNEWVAGFVGEPPMNFLDCTLGGGSEATVVEHAQFRLPVTESQQARLNGFDGAAAVRMGIRPNHVTIGMTPFADDCINASVYVTEPLGGDMLVEVELGADRLLVETTPDFPGNIGDPCYIRFDRRHWHVFAMDTGLALF